MVKISDHTKKVIKKQLLDGLTDDFQTTFDLAKKVGRSHGLTNLLLHQLKEEDKIALSRLGNICAWKREIYQDKK